LRDFTNVGTHTHTHTHIVLKEDNGWGEAAEFSRRDYW